MCASPFDGTHPPRHLDPQPNRSPPSINPTRVNLESSAVQGEVRDGWTQLRLWTMWKAVHGDVARIGGWEEGEEGEAVVLEREGGKAGACQVHVKCPRQGHGWEQARVETDARTCEVHVRCVGEVEFSYAETWTNGATDERGMGKMTGRPRPGHQWEELLLKLRPSKTTPDTITIRKVQFVKEERDAQEGEQSRRNEEQEARRIVDSQMGDVRTFLEEKKRQAEEEQAKGLTNGLMSGNPMALMLSAMNRMNASGEKADSAPASKRPLVEESTPHAEGRKEEESIPTRDVPERQERKVDHAPVHRADGCTSGFRLLEKRIASLEKVVYGALEGFNARIGHLEEKLERATRAA